MIVALATAAAGLLVLHLHPQDALIAATFLGLLAAGLGLRGLMALTVGLAVLTPAYLWLPAIGPVSGHALNHSATSEAGGSVLLDLPACGPVNAGRTSCFVPDAQASGSAEFAVVLDGRCWRARKRSTGGEEVPLPVRVRGCVGLRDQLRPLSRL